MMIVGRGVAGFGAGGEYPVCGTIWHISFDKPPHHFRFKVILKGLCAAAA
jgi:hypothetical protein